MARRAQASGIVGAHREHEHVEPRGGCILQQLEQTRRVQPVDRQYTPFERVMSAQVPDQMAGQR
jgi:hypothetical protein